ncbi:MAG TPA: hypothetical protein DCQ99_01610 [Nitrospinae bacterium]|nr:hypothetical protein [Nitrospinota bacterium]
MNIIHNINIADKPCLNNTKLSAFKLQLPLTHLHFYIILKINKAGTKTWLTTENSCASVSNNFFN